MATQPEDDGFDDAFAQFASKTEGKDGGNGVVEQQQPGAADADGDAGADADTGAADDKPAGDDQGAAGDKPAGDEGDDKGAADDAGVSDADTDDKAKLADADTDDVLARLSSLLKDAPAKIEEKEEPAAQQQEEELPALYTAEETEFLKNYDTDWADVAKGESLKRKAEYRELLQHVFGEVAKHVGPIAELVNELATRTHLGDLQERVPDYNDLRENVVAWVETQPAYLQVGMKEVMKAGTADEVADLIERYRKDTGQAAPAKTDPDGEKKVELSDTAKKAAKELAPVDTKRSVIPQNDDPNDFDSAFAKFAGTTR